MTDIAGLAAQALVDESAVEMATDDGRVEIWTISRDGCVVRASAPRLAVRVGMNLSCRLPVNGQPHRIVATIESAEIQSQTRAALLLRVVAANPDAYHRRSHRVSLSVAASITALVCDRVVPGDVLPISITDLSAGGFGALTSDTRPRIEDLYRLAVRFFEGSLDCDARIKVARPSQVPGKLILGCAFLQLSKQEEETLGRVLVRLVG